MNEEDKNLNEEEKIILKEVVMIKLKVKKERKISDGRKKKGNFGKGDGKFKRDKQK